MTAVDYAFAWGVTVGAICSALLTWAIGSLVRRWRQW